MLNFAFVKHVHTGIMPLLGTGEFALTSPSDL